ncbi:ABC transporter ATP-binding protein [Clostridium sp. D2Q-14]|uniref:ABC transporter ATP-binding protein n=1 Tax=Anaeromonas gelatinilytica TaxID=2683194 RepID=UPI00193BA23D|nr:ABC transporter ATP-binding protein [Anaeromonas gelatinilytica]MBS4535135.1 ABC transporter ATP-binding protein [Anaeromonas gelatinilytica]
MESIITIRNLKKSYGTKEVLKNINLDINKGEIIGYIGPNGAGKSTTVKIMLGLIDEYQGDIKIFGKNIKDDPVEYKRRIGYVPETADIYENLTAREYLIFMGELYGMDSSDVDKKAEKLMELFGIRDVYDGRINSFSKGMKQKVLIISSLLNDPDILFLDEPLSGIDANSVMVFKEVLSELVRDGKTIFYSSHIMEVVEKLSDRIILINDGEIVADGSMKDLNSQLNEGSLEHIFNELTGFKEHKKIAQDIVSTIKRDGTDERL